MNIINVKRMDIFSTLLNWLKGQRNLILYKKVRICKDKSAILDINGRLSINRNWKRSNVIPTMVRMDEMSVWKVSGRFQIYYGSDIILFPGAVLEMGSGYSNINLLIRCRERISIGDNVKMAHNVTIMDSDFHEFSVQGRSVDITAPVVIGDGVWIGSGATILKGVTIGEGSIIGAGAVVTKSVPPHSVAIGNPAAVIRENQVVQK